MPYLENRGNRRRRMAAIFAVLAVGSAAGVGVRWAAAAESPAAAPEIQSTLESVDAQGHHHPVTLPEDYVRIADAPAAAPAPAAGRRGFPRPFTAQCGRNTNGHRNSDNFIASPGVSNGAHHTHDYVGNLTTDGNSTNDSLAAAGTDLPRAATCPRTSGRCCATSRTAGADAGRPGGGADGNMGTILTPAQVSLQFLGNAAGQGRRDAALPAGRHRRREGRHQWAERPLARAHWTCSGTHNKASGTQYPICPRGQLVQRINDFPGCWNGTDLDSANHRTHVAFADPATGACPAGFQAIPQLRITLSYRVAPGASFAVDTFPEQLRKAVTDHNDFVDVMPDRLMGRVVACINRGIRC